MKCVRSDITRIVIVVGAAAVMLLCNPAHAEPAVTGEQADRIAADAATEEFDMQVVQTVIVSEPEAQPAWFPTLTEQDLTVNPKMLHVTAFAAPAPAEGEFATREHAAIPLPPGAWTGLAGLGSLALVRGRKAIVQFFT